jgi:hypothetical protein
MKKLALISALALGGCFTYWDPHATATIVAPEQGGDLRVPHGARLRVPLVAETGFEWHRVEPQTMMVVAEGPPDERGQMFTPVRTGEEKLRLEYRPIDSTADPKRVVEYNINVPEGGRLYMFWQGIKNWFRRSQDYY